EADGVDAAFEAVRAVLSGATDLDALVVGAAGAEAAPAEARRLADRLAGWLPGCAIGVTSDSVTAHAGALGGRAGTVLAVGTGSVALGVAADGRFHQVDGWGPWLGDDGSGAWIGREALRAVLLSREGRGPATRLADLAEERFGDLLELPRTLAVGGAVARTTATFVPDVLAAAEAGDRVAAQILHRATQAWADLTAGAAAMVGESRVAAVGGLTSVGTLTGKWVASLPAALSVEPASGTALDGALLLARHDDLPHERRVLRTVAVPTREAAAPVQPRHEVDVLATEQVRDDLHDLDTRGAEDLVRLLLDAEETVPAAMAAARRELARAVELAASALAAGGRIVYVGAGTPGRLAALDAAECPPTFGTSPQTVVAVLAGGNEAAARAVEGAEDDADAGARDVTALGLGPRDLVVGISASGRTPYVLAALDAARERGCRTVAVVNNAGSPARAHADLTVELLTGGEVLAGSTRLKAGTAQKIALNVLSTGAMIGNGKTYGAWMVDVMASNEKLRRRARRILREATGVDDDTAVVTLEQAGWRTKTALVAILAGVDVDRAQALLDSRDGRVRDAVAAAAVAPAEAGR
ncbi:MAG TPA: N-acetylmuramic acid 6-phosphate etherase, partial [Nocardioidaceae bacterium]|nr:N-acetylmuramic acid 6-phosphate etherase [Nocardioidaceae bacterium]